jgi:hypothetical protein
MTVESLSSNESTSSSSHSLFMVEIAHKPENCIANGSIESKSNAALLKGLHESAAQLGATIVDGWAFPIGHRLWYVVKAENAHIAAKIFGERRVHTWNTITVNPVLDHESFGREIIDPILKPEPELVE